MTPSGSAYHPSNTGLPGFFGVFSLSWASTGALKKTVAMSSAAAENFVVVSMRPPVGCTLAARLELCPHQCSYLGTRRTAHESIESDFSAGDGDELGRHGV